jgi:hypothetical protein
MTHTSQSPSLIMQTRDDGNKGVTRDCMLIHIMFGVMSGLTGSKCIMHTIVYHSYSSNACF